MVDISIIFSFIAIIISFATFYYNFLRKGKLLVVPSTRITICSFLYKPIVNIFCNFHNHGTKSICIQHVSLTINNKNLPDNVCFINVTEILDGNFKVSHGKVLIAKQDVSIPFKPFIIGNNEKLGIVLIFIADNSVKYEFSPGISIFRIDVWTTNKKKPLITKSFEVEINDDLINKWYSNEYLTKQEQTGSFEGINEYIKEWDFITKIQNPTSK
jgi:hypothetical protein